MGPIRCRLGTAQGYIQCFFPAGYGAIVQFSSYAGQGACHTLHSLSNSVGEMHSPTTRGYRCFWEDQAALPPHEPDAVNHDAVEPKWKIAKNIYSQQSPRS